MESLTSVPCSIICVWQNLGWTLMEDGSIRIEEATEEALGTYTCVPYNTLGTMGQSAPARLVLKVRSWGCDRLHELGPWIPGLMRVPVLSSPGPPLFHGATRLGVQAGGRPGAAYPLRGCGGPLSCHHVEKGSWALELLGLWGGVRTQRAVLFWTCPDQAGCRAVS